MARDAPVYMAVEDQDKEKMQKVILSIGNKTKGKWIPKPSEAWALLAIKEIRENQIGTIADRLVIIKRKLFGRVDAAAPEPQNQGKKAKKGGKQ